MTNIQRFITEYNGFDRIGGGYLYDLIKHEDIFAGDKCNVDQVVAYIAKSTWEETQKLIEPTCNDLTYTRRILWMSWLMLKGETMLKETYVDTELIEPIEPLEDDEDDDDFDEDEEDEDEEDLEEADRVEM